MRIKEVTEEHILFDNGNTITFGHHPDCCENNYADFRNLDNGAFQDDFDENLIFEAVENSGFRFGSKNTPMYFVPCYSEQNGYYSCDIQIYYNGEEQLYFDAEERFV